MLGGDQWRFLSHNVAGGNIPGVEEKWPWPICLAAVPLTAELFTNSLSMQ